MDDATRKTARAGTTVELKIIVAANTDNRLAGAAKVGNDQSIAGRAGNRLKLDSHRMIVEMQPAVGTLSGQKPFGRLVYLAWPYPQSLSKVVTLRVTGRFAAAKQILQRGEMRPCFSESGQPMGRCDQDRRRELRQARNALFNRRFEGEMCKRKPPSPHIAVKRITGAQMQGEPLALEQGTRR